MTGIYESISVCLYAAGAVLMTAAAVVYKRNGLYEYYCLMHGKPVKAKKTNDTAERPAVRTMDTGTTLIKDVQVQENHARVRATRAEPGIQEVGTQVLDGGDDTTLLGKESCAENKRAEYAQGGRTWGKPTGEFRVTKSEVVIHTDRDIRVRTGTKGEKDEV